MGLISRVSSRTYRKKQKLIIMSQAIVWGITRQNHAYLLKSRKNGGVQVDKHPANLKNKNALKYSGIANAKAIAIQAGDEGAIVLKSGKKSVTWTAKKGQRRTVVKVSNLVGKMNPGLKGAAQKRVSALIRCQKK